MTRPFDKEKASAGHPITIIIGVYTGHLVYVSGPDKNNQVVLTNDGCFQIWSASSVCMKPVGEVEGQEVYPGDVVYGVSTGRRYVVGSHAPGKNLMACEYEAPDGRVFKTTEGSNLLSFMKPKVVRTGYVRIDVTGSEAKTLGPVRQFQTDVNPRAGEVVGTLTWEE